MMKPAFGIFDYTMIPKIRRLLKPHGLDLRVKADRRNWGDQVEVTVVTRTVDIRPCGICGRRTESYRGHKHGCPNGFVRK